MSYWYCSKKSSTNRDLESSHRNQDMFIIQLWDTELEALEVNSLCCKYCSAEFNCLILLHFSLYFEKDCAALLWNVRTSMSYQKYCVVSGREENYFLEVFQHYLKDVHLHLEILIRDLNISWKSANLRSVHEAGLKLWGD